MKIGLVLEGGGVRGIYTAGVLDVFMENGITFDGVIGVSAGAIHGCSYLSGQNGRSIRYYKKYSKDYRFMSFRSFITTGNFVGADFCYRELPDKLDKYDNEAFKNNPTEFYITCSNVESGEAEYIKITDMHKQIHYLRASASLPFLSKIVELNEKKYLDGGCTDSIPIKAFKNMGFLRNVVVLTRHTEYRKSPTNKILPKLKYRKYPNFVSALLNRHVVYNQTVEEISDMEKRGEIFVIRPSEDLNIGRLEKDPNEIQRVYDIGRKDATKALKDLLKWMKKND